jgi:hypothetical protein
MNRNRFFGLAVSSGALLATVAFSGACSGGSGTKAVGGGGLDGGADGADGAPTAVNGDVQALAQWCADEQQKALDAWAADTTQPIPVFDDVPGAAEILAARASFAAGGTDIPLSPSKCTRLWVKRDAAGAIVEETIVHAPFKLDIDAAAGTVVFHPAALGHWIYTPTGYTFRGDYDADGFDEFRSSVTYEKSSVFEERAPSNDAVLARTTGTVQGGALSIQREAVVDGTLTTTRNFVTSVRQKSCNPPAPKPDPVDPTAGPVDLPTRACTAGESDTINKTISTALQKGTGCLLAAGMQAQSDAVLKTFVHSELKLDCIDHFANPDDAFSAANDRGYMDAFPGKARLIVYTGILGRPQNELDGLIGHELFHFFGAHDHDLNAAATEDQMRYSDQVYACEYLCFGSMPNRCHLAACQGKKAPTSWNAKSCTGDLRDSDITAIEKARGDGVSIGDCTGGKQVGALCRSNAAGQVQFCTTEIECEVSCGGPCESQSIACLPDCR